jgi:hypothetical protein
MKKTMNMPGFTAEAALFDARQHYKVTEDSTPSAGTIQPAGIQTGLGCLKSRFQCDNALGHHACYWHAIPGRINSSGVCE